MRFIKIKLVMAFFLFGASGCTQTIVRKKSAAATPPVEEKKDVAITPIEVKKDIFSLGPSFKLLSGKQIENKLEFCLGEGKQIIPSDAIIPVGDLGGAETSRPKDAFLLGDKFSEGENIVTKFTYDYDGPIFLTATTSRVSKISVSYLSALQNMANLAAFNCKKELLTDSENSLCNCGEADKAVKMLERCLPDVNIKDEKHTSLLETFTQKCEENNPSAIASLLASILFARSP